MTPLLDFLLPQTSLTGQVGAWFTPEELQSLFQEKSLRRLEEEELGLRSFSGISRLVAVTEYSRAPLIRLALHRLKYQGVINYAEPLGRFMLTLAPHFQTPLVDAVCPVPLHWSRRFWRGFNQSELLARPLARELHVPLLRLLRRRRGGRSQVGRSAEERREALAGAFRASAVPRHVLLVDDVVTTGGTISACSSALFAAGAERVSVACLAYAA